MRFSWTEFAVGVILGAAGVTLLFVSTSYWVLSVLLLLPSIAFMTQAPETTPTPEPAAAGLPDAHEWRGFGRGLFDVLRSAGLLLVVYRAGTYLWNLVVRREPSLANLSLAPLFPIFATAWWLLHAVTLFRSGRRRLASAHHSGLGTTR